MKLLLACMLPALVFFLATPAQCATDEDQLLTEAQRAYAAGDSDTAKTRFTQVLEMDPSNIVAKNYLRMIRVAEQQKGGPGDLQKQLESLVVSKVDLKEATFGSALEYLKQLAARESQGKAKVNFVVNLPADFATTQKVTLNLGGVPFTEVLHYLGDLAGVQFSYEKYAVVVKMKDAVAASASQAAPAP